MSEFSYINDLAKKCAETDHIEASLYTKYDVKRGLRDADGKGVLTGLTEISSVHGTKEEMGSKEYCDGELRYRGIDIKDLVGGFVAENRFGFEEVIYLLLIGHLPMITIYSYHSYNHVIGGHSLVINMPSRSKSMAENILIMLRRDKKYTELEARLLDLSLILHAEHGGGNNSTFTNRVVTSSGTDTYSAMAASLCSLKGPRHGGANVKVVHMFADIMTNVSDWTSDDAVAAYLTRILNKEAFDRSGLIYGIGHAIYTKSDPRALIFKEHVKKLAIEKGRTEEFELYERVERLAPELLYERNGRDKPICANVDFYSGFVYSMLNLPDELYTPIFAIARIAGWSAHRLEELVTNGKIIRPAYMGVQPDVEYVPLMFRK